MAITLYIIGGILVLIFLAGIRIIRPTERGLVETLGKYRGFANPGFHWIIPLIQRLFKVNVTERLVDAKRQEVITEDNLNAAVDAQVYYRIKEEESNVKNSQYHVNDVRRQIVQLARTTLRNIIGTMTLKDANSKRDTINKDLMDVLIKETKNWGIDIVRTELKEIEPPKDVQETMNKVVKAENEKIAAKDFATARETEADGERRAAIKKAEGIKRATVLKAQGEATAIKLVNESAERYFKGNAKDLKKMEVTEASLKDNSKIILTEKGVNPNLIIGKLDTN